MATKSGGETPDSETPWTSQQFSTWKRREKGRLVKLRSSLEEQFAEVPVPSKLKDQLVEAETKVRTLQSEVDGLELTRRRSYPVGLDSTLVDQEKKVDHWKRQVDVRLLFKGSAKSKLEVAESKLRTLQEDHAKKERLMAAKAEARRQLPEITASLEMAKANRREIREPLDNLSKLLQPVHQGSKMLATTLPLDAFVDRCLADLEKKPPRPWMVEGVTAYVEEIGLKKAAKLKREKEAEKARVKVEKKLKSLRSQRDRKAEEISELEEAKASRSNAISALKLRIKRTEDRLALARGRGNWRSAESISLRIRELREDLGNLTKDAEKIPVLKKAVKELDTRIAEMEKAAGVKTIGPVGKAPRAGFIANDYEFEKFMAAWMRWLGWADAKAVPKGPDGGVDVIATGALGQAKYWNVPVAIEDIQRHNGVCEGIPKYGRVFLAKNGYSPQAIKWADDHDLPLFEMKAGSKDAGVVASTKAGEKLLQVGAKAMKGSKRN